MGSVLISHQGLPCATETRCGCRAANWQSSNQPDAEPLKDNPRNGNGSTNTTESGTQSSNIRHWQRSSRTYLLNDFDNNRGRQSAKSHWPFRISSCRKHSWFPASLEAAAGFKYFQPFNENRNFTVTPLLTPDNYQPRCSNWSNSATTEILIQNQSFNAPKTNHTQLKQLLQAVLDEATGGR